MKNHISSLRQESALKLWKDYEDFLALLVYLLFYSQVWNQRLSDTFYMAYLYSDLILSGKNSLSHPIPS
jgi:hypothetical protein